MLKQNIGKIFKKISFRTFKKKQVLNLSKNLIDNFEEEIKNFVQVCPKEMIDKLENPITLKSKIKEVS